MYFANCSQGEVCSCLPVILVILCSVLLLKINTESDHTESRRIDMTEATQFSFVFSKALVQESVLLVSVGQNIRFLDENLSPKYCIRDIGNSSVQKVILTTESKVVCLFEGGVVKVWSNGTNPLCYKPISEFALHQNVHAFDFFSIGCGIDAIAMNSDEYGVIEVQLPVSLFF